MNINKFRLRIIMSFQVKWDEKAIKQLEKLPKEITRRIVLKIRRIAETGRGIEPLKDFSYGFKIRIGDYRVLADLYSESKLLVIRVVDHRKRVYKRQ